MMMRKVELFLLKRHRTTWKSLLLCFILLLVKVVPSSSQTISPSTHTSTILRKSASTSLMSIVPTPSPLPQYTCQSGPDTEDFRNVIIGTNKIYLDVSKPINCSGAITSWQYCHFIIGFRNASSGLWPCVWRQSNDSEATGYENVGCNKFTVIPGDGDNFRCQYFIPSIPADVIEVKEGDYIGFYVPDSGLLPALSQVDDNAGDDQLLRVRNVTGFTSYLKDSELRIVNPPSGSALLRAEIDSDWVYPSIVLSSGSISRTVSPEPTPLVTDQQATTTAKTTGAALILPLGISLVVTVGVTVVLVITVIALIAYVNCKPKHPSRNDRNLSGVSNDMEYNDMYGVRNAHCVAAENKHPAMKLRDNPAYDSRYLPHRPHAPMEITTSSLERRQLEHTYESLSDF